MACCIAEIGPDEYHATLSVIPMDMRIVEALFATAPANELAEARRDYLMMSLATELRARGHVIIGAAE